MEIIFIGTSSGKTSLFRKHSSVLINTLGHKLLVDAGDGISRALLNLKIDLETIDSILLTHYHADHFGGISALITQMKLIERTNKLTIYTHEKLIKPLMSYLNSCYLFVEILGFDIATVGFDFEKKIQVNNSLSFSARQNSHIRDRHNLEKNYQVEFISSSFLFETESKNIVYTSDIGNADDLMLFANSKINIFISETTHVSFEDIFAAAEKLGADKVFLTHIEAKDENFLQSKLESLDDEVNKKYSLAYDGLVIKS